MAEHTTDTNALPDAAWFAEHIMKWHKDWHEMPGNIMMHHAWFDADGVFQAWVAAWNPKTHDAAALQLLDNLCVLTPEKSSPWWELQFHHGRFSCAIFPFITPLSKLPSVSTGENPIRPLAICRAVHAWWLAQPTVHNTGTGEHP